MNWNSPVADEVFALAFGLRLDSRSAVLSRYSTPAPVTRAASRIAPVTRVAISVVAPLMRVAMSIAASVPMGGAQGGRDACPPLAPSAVMVNDGLIREPRGTGLVPPRGTYMGEMTDMRSPRGGMHLSG